MSIANNTVVATDTTIIGSTAAADSTVAAIADPMVTTTINSTAAANPVGSMSSLTTASTFSPATPWVLQSPFGATGGSTLSGTVGSTSSGSVRSFFGSGVGVFGANTSDMGHVQLLELMLPAVKPPKFGGSDFKMWQGKMLSYLTILGLVSFLTEDEPTTPSAQETNSAVREAYDNWKLGDYMCKISILMYLDSSLYNVYSIVKTSKEMWDALDKKYRSDDVGTKKHVVARFLDYKMVDTRTIMEQVNEFQLLIHEVHAEEMIISDSFYVAAMFDKLPPSWREFKGYLKESEVTLQSLIMLIAIQTNFVESQGH